MSTTLTPHRTVGSRQTCRNAGTRRPTNAGQCRQGPPARDDADGVGREADHGGAANAYTFIWDGQDLINEYVSGGLSTRHAVLAREVLGHKGGANRYLYVPDPFGSVNHLLDTSQTIAGTYTYWPYGEVQSHTGPDTPLQFVGGLGYYTGVVNRTYVRARWYRPDLGRWQGEQGIATPPGQLHCSLEYVTTRRGSNRGDLRLCTLNVCYVYQAYSGKVGCGGESQCVECKGPIPRGSYTTARAWERECRSDFIKGWCLWIFGGEPCAGRSGFAIHRIQGTTAQSRGCIVLTEADLADLRRRMAAQCAAPVPLRVVHQVADEGECSAALQGLRRDCTELEGARNRCRVGCGRP